MLGTVSGISFVANSTAGRRVVVVVVVVVVVDDDDKGVLDLGPAGACGLIDRWGTNICRPVPFVFC